jgi:DNA-binding NtrC family response regulator
MALQGRTLLIINSNSGMVELLRDWFAGQGMQAGTATLDEVARWPGSEAIVTADVVLFDLSVPYDRHWRVFQSLQSAGAFGPTPVVLTTTNEHALRQVVGSTDAFEVVGTPHDLWQLQDVVDQALEGDGPRPAATVAPRERPHARLFATVGGVAAAAGAIFLWFTRRGGQARRDRSHQAA